MEELARQIKKEAEENETTKPKIKLV